MRTIGYVNGAITDTETQKQLAALSKHKVELIITEETYNKTSEALEEIITVLTPGDKIIVEKIIYLSKSINQLSEFLQIIKEKEIELVVIDKGKCFSKIDDELYMDILLQIAQDEKKVIKERTKQGILEAKRQGRVGGRPKISEEKIKRIRYLYHNQSYTLREIAEDCDVSLGTAYKYI